MVPKYKTHQQKTKIALIVPAFPKLSETFIVSKFLGLWQKSWDIHIVCSHSESTEWEHFPELQTRVEVKDHIHISWPTHLRWLAGLLFPVVFFHTLLLAPRSSLHYLQQGWHQFGVDIFRRFYLDAKLIALQPDIIHFEFGTLAVGRMYLKELLNSKLTVSFRGYDINYVGLEEQGYYRQVWEKADAFHFLGQALWRRAQRRGCPPDKPHTLIPPAIDVDYFYPQERDYPELVGISERPLRLLSVGRLAWKKGYEYSLQAVKLLGAQGVICEYRILGGGDFLEALAFARHQLDLENVVKFIGAVPREEVNKHLHWADVFLHGAVSEGFCNAVMEAQAMQLPVVCTDADGLPENVSHGKTGFVVPRRDAQALAEKMLILAKSSSLRRKMGQAGRKRADALFRLQDQIDTFDEMFLDVTGE